MPRSECACPLSAGVAPDSVLRARVAVTGCPGEQTALQAEAEQMFAGPGLGHLESRPLGDEELGQCLPDGRIINGLQLSGCRTADLAYLRSSGDEAELVLWCGGSADLSLVAGEKIVTEEHEFADVAGCVAVAESLARRQVQPGPTGPDS
jgi:hypothetical protein